MRNKIIEKRLIEQIEYFKKCDLCGFETYAKDEKWSTSPYNILETEVKIKEGKNYPEGGDWVEKFFDICPQCFKEKLIPWLENQGVKINIKEYDY